MTDSQLARILKAAADPTRVGILRLLLQHEHAVGELADALGLTVARVSHHLAILRAEDLIVHRRQGKQVIYGARTSEAPGGSPEVLALMSAIAAPRPETATELVVYAASDLSFAFEAVGRSFRAATGINVRFRFMASGRLGRCLAEAPEADLCVTASAQAMERLASGRQIDPGTSEGFAQGRLMLWRRHGHPARLESVQDLLRPEIPWVAIPNPGHAPNGAAAVELLRQEGVWEALRPKVIFSNDASQALEFADTENAGAAIVSSALGSRVAGHAIPLPASLHPPLDHTVALTRCTLHPREARAFAAYLFAQPCVAILRQHGFAPAS